MLLYFIRHGDPIYDPDSLTDKGKLQAELLSERLSEFKIDKIYSSTSERALQTAMPTAKKLALNICKLDWCNEKYAGEEFSIQRKSGSVWMFEDEPTLKVFNKKEIRQLDDLWYEDSYFRQSGAKSGMLRINKQVDEWIKTFGYKHDRENHKYISVDRHPERIALFAHGGFGMAFLSSLLDIPYPLFCLHFQYSVLSCMTVIDFSGNEEICPKIVEYSNDSHLYKANLKPYHYYREF